MEELEKFGFKVILKYQVADFDFFRCLKDGLTYVFTYYMSGFDKSWMVCIDLEEFSKLNGKLAK